jgi:hypothetical protein
MGGRRLVALNEVKDLFSCEKQVLRSAQDDIPARS